MWSLSDFLLLFLLPNYCSMNFIQSTIFIYICRDTNTQNISPDFQAIHFDVIELLCNVINVKYGFYGAFKTDFVINMDVFRCSCDNKSGIWFSYSLFVLVHAITANEKSPRNKFYSYFNCVHAVRCIWVANMKPHFLKSYKLCHVFFTYITNIVNVTKKNCSSFSF